MEKEEQFKVLWEELGYLLTAEHQPDRCRSLVRTRGENESRHGTDRNNAAMMGCKKLDKNKYICIKSEILI